MPNTREKLIELLEDRRLEASEVCGSMNKGFGAWYADHLIANGVTVQKWIPVTERLPEEMGFYLTARKRDVFVEQWNGVCFSERCHLSQPTHWMPLPQPPKGE